MAHGQIMGQIMGEQWQLLVELDAKVNVLSQAISNSTPPCLPPQPYLPPMPAQEKFSGKVSQCQGFLLQCSINLASFEGMTESFY